MYHFKSNLINANIFAHAKGDVNGDGIPDHVYLNGIKMPDSPYIQNITLVIRDGMTDMITSIPLKDNTGYGPTLFLGDFNGDGVDDILIGIATGGSGGIIQYYIYSFVDDTAQLIFDFNLYNEEYNYDVIYEDNYKVQVNSKENDETYLLDISYRSADYLDEIYDKDGKLKNPIIGFVDPLSGLYPVDFDSNKIYELFAFQKISGRYHADSLGYVLNTLKWKNDRFVLDDQYVAIYGSQG